MDPKVIRPQAADIQKRFFLALDILIESRKVRGLKTFCAEYGLHRPKYSNLRTFTRDGTKGSGYKFIDLDALYYLVADYGVSSDWLILGKGGMFRTTKLQ